MVKIYDVFKEIVRRTRDTGERPKEWFVTPLEFDELKREAEENYQFVYDEKYMGPNQLMIAGVRISVRS